MNPAEDQYILQTHRALTSRVNRTRWQYETTEAAAPAAAPWTLGERTRRRVAAMLIRGGERLLPTSPSLADCEPC